MRKPPVLATLVVLIAVAAMVSLGFWQLHRLRWKEDLLARYGAASAIAAPLPLDGRDLPEAAAYRHVRWDCPRVGVDQVVAGRGAAGASGWAHVMVCTHRAGGADIAVPVVLGWSFGLAPVQWAGGAIAGVAVPGPKAGVSIPASTPGIRALDWHIVADPPVAGLAANAPPDPRAIPNNHLSYAIQWFFFAATATVIFILALRRK